MPATLPPADLPLVVLAHAQERCAERLPGVNLDAAMWRAKLAAVQVRRPGELSERWADRATGAVLVCVVEGGVRTLTTCYPAPKRCKAVAARRHAKRRRRELLARG